MKVAPLAFFGLTLASLAACDRTDSPAAARTASEASAARPPTPSTLLYRAAECDGSAMGSPVVGQTFEYRMLTPEGKPDPQALIRRTVRSVSGDLVDYTEELSMAGMGAMPPEPRQVRLAILPTRHVVNTVRYEDATASIQALTPTQSTVIAMAESMAGSSQPPSEGEATVTFLGCGISEPIITGAPGEPVRAYRVQLPYSNAEAPGKLTEMIDTEFVVSQNTGWPIAERQRSGVIVLSASE